MSRRRSPLLCALLALALAGCVAKPPSAVPPRTGGTRPGASPVPARGDGPAGVASPATGLSGGLGQPPVGGPGAGLVAAGAGNLIGADGATLVGVASGPAGLIGADGGSLIGADGGSLIGADGGSLVAAGAGNLVAAGAGNYGLRQTPPAAEVAVRNARVALVDAGGQPVRGADGKPLETTTDDQGRFHFTAPLPDRHVVAVIQVAGGRLRGLALRAGAARREARLDLAGALTTGYILEKFVAGQADPVAALEKLPSELGAATRASAVAALAAGAGAPPASLAPAELVKAVDALRGRDAAFDAKLQEVERLFIGQSNLGEGQPALEASLGVIRHLALDADGSLLIVCMRDDRIWRVGADGLLRLAVGGAPEHGGSLAGEPATRAGLAHPYGVAADRRGRLLVLDAPKESTEAPPRSRLSWRGTDGVMADAGALPPDALLLGAWPGEGEEALVLAAGKREPRDGDWYQGPAAAPAVWAVAPGQAPRRIAEVAATAGPLVPERETAAFRFYAPNLAFGVGPGGAVWLGTPTEPTAYRLDEKTWTPRAVVAESGALDALALAADGHTAYVEGGKVLLRSPAGVVRTLLDPVPEDFRAGVMPGAAVAPDGTVFLVQRKNRVYKVQDGRFTHVAGRVAANTGDATELSLRYPSGLAVAANGDLYVGDRGADKVFRVAKDGSVVRVAGSGAKQMPTAPGPALDTAVFSPRAVRLDAAGALYVLMDTSAIWKVDAAGTFAPCYAAPANHLVRGFDVAPDGTVYAALRDLGDGAAARASVVRVAPDGKATDVIAPTAAVRGHLLGVGPDGTLHVLTVPLDAGPRELARWTAAGGLVPVLASDQLPATFPYDSNALAIDGRGRVALTLVDEDRVLLIDPATKAIEPIAGAGAPSFAGDGVDDGLDGPRYPAFDAAGTLYFADMDHRQVKRIPAEKL